VRHAVETVALVVALAALVTASALRDALVDTRRPAVTVSLQRHNANPVDRPMVAALAQLEAASSLDQPAGASDQLAAASSPVTPEVAAAQAQLSSGDHADLGIFLPPASLTYPLQLISLGNWSERGSYFDPQQYAPFGEMLPTVPSNKPVGEPRHRASIDPGEALKADGAPRRSVPAIVKPLVTRIRFSAPVLAPMAHTLFCLRYPSDCRVRKIVFRGGAFKLTAERRAELERVNAEVNRSIVPKRDTEWLRGEGWLIAPKAGDCNDFAVTKRHELLARGWPERALLLSEVVTSWGEHHLVLVVRTNEGDLIADNLYPKIRNWVKAPYQWVRIQSPRSPNSWSSIANAAA
jgi:predicted transglutaminase-like cysteine proteinase